MIELPSFTSFPHPARLFRTILDFNLELQVGIDAAIARLDGVRCPVSSKELYNFVLYSVQICRSWFLGANLHVNMPGPTLKPYDQVPETKYDLDWAELVTLDLGVFDKPGGKEELVRQLQYAAQHVGFFHVVNFGISQEEVDQQFALGREFYDLPLEEKL